MHTIEPYFKWRDLYIASEDTASPFYGTTYNEFSFTKKIYNYFIHPQWDNFGSPTLYTKILYVDYDEHFAILEFIGEWNDCVTNDIMHLKRNIVDQLIDQGISKFVLVCENVLNFHGSDECYYEEWRDDVIDSNGWVVFMNTLDHIETEMRETQLHHYVNLGEAFVQFDGRGAKPQNMINRIEEVLLSSHRSLQLP